MNWLERRDFIARTTAIALGAATVGPDNGGASALVPHVDAADTPRRVGLADIRRIEATTAAFRRWDNQWGGGLSRAAVVAQLQWVLATSRSAACASEEVRRRLLSAAADLANVAAFMSYDVERQEEARRMWLVGLSAAREANNLGLAGSTLRQLAHQALHLQRPNEALRLIRVSQAATADPDHDASDVAMAETAAYQGWSYAAAGRAQECDRAFGQAEEYFESAGEAAVPPWLGHFRPS